MKKVLSFMLCTSMILSLCGSLPAFHATENPEGTPISSVEEFVSMDAGGTYYLANDIDFSGETYSKNVYPKAFTGVLDGNGHSLLNITIQGKNTDVGIFANQFSGKVMNLGIGTEEAPVSVSSIGGGQSVAVMAGTVKSGATFENITIYANLKGDGKTAAFTSYMPSGTLTINKCRVYGSVAGNPAAGLVTMSPDGSSDITITNSENHASVTAKNLSAGGIYTTHADVGSSRRCNLTVVGCANYGAISATDWRVGGIVGEFNELKASTLNISYCYNLGPVTMTGGGGFAGGIVGGMCFDAPTGARTVSNVYNVGLVRNTANSGNAFAIAFAHSSNGNITLTNAAYLEGTASKNTIDTNVAVVSDLASILNTVKTYPEGGKGLSFVADTGNLNDGYPMLAWQINVHENILTYSCGRKVCQDCNTVLSLPENEKHSFSSTIIPPEGVRDGSIISICQHCNYTQVVADQPSTSHPPMDGDVYVFTDPLHLLWYSVNLSIGLLSGNESIRLDADLDIANTAFAPIGGLGKGFSGTFDGNGHTIHNLHAKTDGTSGMFAKVGMGSKIMNLTIDGATVEGTSDCGALVGKINTGAVVIIENVAVINSTITSENGNAGGLVGSSDGAADLRITCAVSDGVTVSGKSAGGILGSGNSALLTNVYANAKLTANGGKTASLATHSSSFTAKNCGYSKSTAASQKDGTAYEDSAFVSGEIAYLINTYGARKVFGVVNGKTALSDTPVKLAVPGTRKSYTNKALSMGDGTAVYALPAEGDMILAIVQVKNAPHRLIDSQITVNGKEIKFSDLTLCRYAAVGESYYVAEEGAVLYTIQIAVSDAPTVNIANCFDQTAIIVN